MATVKLNKGDVNEGWIVADVKFNHSKYQDKILHWVKLSKGGEIFEALEVAPTSNSKFYERINEAVDFVIKSAPFDGKPAWIAVDDVLPTKFDFKDSVYMARDAVKCTIELMTNGNLEFKGIDSIETNSRHIVQIMMKLAKENSNGN